MRFRFHPFSLLIAFAMFSPGLRAAEEEKVGGIRPTVTLASGDTGGTFFGRAPDPAKTRRYYIAAESELWDYAPTGREELCGGSLPPPLLRNRKSGKLRYVQYTDATFTTKVIPNRSLGILGPVLRGVVGEFLAVTFVNRTDQPLSIHPHGVKYDKHSEGAFHLPAEGRGSAVAPGARFTYVWQLDEQSGPMPGEPSSKGWLYHSHVTGDAETNLGLIGAIIVTDPQRARPDGTPRDVDREFATLFMIFDESGLDEAAIEAAEYAGLPGMASQAPPLSWAELQQQLEQGSRFSINGRVFGNLAGLQMNEGERTRWYLFGLGSEQDFHTAHWHGLRVIEEGRRRTDVIELMPASMKVADVLADNPGNWLFHCHVAEHMREGMFTSITVHARNTVGVDRAPAAAFLGYVGAANSLRLDRAESVTNTAARPSRSEIVVEGAVTVFEGFAVHNESIRIGVGNRTVELHPQSNGEANDPLARFRVKNANEFGVVLGGVMEFELVLQGAEWLREIEASSTSAPLLKLSLEVGRGKHVAQRGLVPRSRAL
jgi:hypothetical protein